MDAYIESTKKKPDIKLKSKEEGYHRYTACIRSPHKVTFIQCLDNVWFKQDHLFKIAYNPLSMELSIHRVKIPVIKFMCTTLM